MESTYIRTGIKEMEAVEVNDLKTIIEDIVENYIEEKLEYDWVIIRNFTKNESVKEKKDKDVDENGKEIKPIALVGMGNEKEVRVSSFKNEKIGKGAFRKE